MVNTPVMVSAGSTWHRAFWRDNTRALEVYRGNLKDDGPLTLMRQRDLALSDSKGNPMYLAANRERPAFVQLVDTEAPLFVETASSQFTQTTIDALRRLTLELMKGRKPG